MTEVKLTEANVTEAGRTTFDAEAKERALQNEAASWDTSSPVPAEAGDIPIIDVSAWFSNDDQEALKSAAAALREASEQVGFHQLTGHGIDQSLIDEVFAMTERFHKLPPEIKSTIRMDRPEWPIGGVGYLPVGERKLPRRTYGNLNEAFLMKSTEPNEPENNQWLEEAALPGFRTVIERYAAEVEALALRLLPMYAVALELAPDYFDAAFQHPFWRLRLSHYPPDPPGPEGAFGIAPHVDTTVFTLLLQNGPGLTIFHEGRQRWVEAPVIDGAFVVNSGELLRQWTNDRFLSTRHFANNLTAQSRYSIPFFFNATADYEMACLPSCHGPGNPPKYPPVSYATSQGVVQGE
ncbi:MAG: isopenicillin N synthase family dioxygenase [Acidimicrobiales bacterium]